MSDDIVERARATVREFLERVAHDFDSKLLDYFTVGNFRVQAMVGEVNPDRPSPREGMTVAEKIEVYREFPDRLIYDDAKGARLVAKAANNASAANALAEIAVEIIQRGKPLPQNLGKFVVSRLETRPAGKRGRRLNQPRDTYIACAVALARDAGLRPTRDDASRDRNGSACGCSVVSEVMRELGHPVAESTVKNIWGKFKHMDPARN